MIKKLNENTYVEYRDRLTAGEKERYKHANLPKVKVNEKGEMIYDVDNTYENSPNFYILSRVVTKIVQDGKDITPKDKNVSTFLEMMDNDLYEDKLLNDVLKDILGKNGFLEQKEKSEINTEISQE